MTATFEEGLLVGLLVGEGHFGGDGRQPQVTLRMHERHGGLFRWLERTFPGGRLYGPYDHGGRRYYQWMARGAFLRDELLPLLDRRLTASFDDYAHARFLAMRDRYARQLGLAPDTGPGAAAAAAPRRDAGAADPGPPSSTLLRASRAFAALRDQEPPPSGP
jgi:hypothetical protein